MMTVSNGNDDFWRQAYDEHAAAVLGFLRRRVGGGDEAEDLLQDVFVRAMRAGSLRPDGQVRAYLFSVARNLTISRSRRPRLVVSGAGDVDADTRPSPLRDPERTANWSSFQHQLESVLSSMSDAHRRAFELGVFQQRSYREISELTGWSLAQVKVNIFRARKRVIEDLGDRLPLM